MAIPQTSFNRNYIDEVRDIVDFRLADYNIINTCTVQFALKERRINYKIYREGKSNVHAA